jgi:surface carbohydrate biosynthesis protein (TIGR04326 family)
MQASPDPDGAPLLLWAGDPADAPASANVILWSGLAPGGGARCITDVVEENGDAIRARYLSWVYELGELRVQGRPLRECFRLPQGQDLWSQSTIVEQSPWKQPSIEPILKLMALEVVLARERPRIVRYIGPDRNVSAILQSLCNRSGIAYQWQRLRVPGKLTGRTLLRGLPNFLQALLLFAQLCATRLALPRPRVATSKRPGLPRGRRSRCSGRLCRLSWPKLAGK